MKKNSLYNTILPQTVLELYACLNNNKLVFFDTFDESLFYKDANKGELVTIYYAKNYFNQDDIFIFINNYGHINIYTALDYENFLTFNQESFQWYKEKGSIRFLYNAFRSRGIDFINDIYNEFDNKIDYTYKLNNQEK